MKLLVIGGCGFFGAHVVDKLLTYGHSVRVFDRQGDDFARRCPAFTLLWRLRRQDGACRGLVRVNRSCTTCLALRSGTPTSIQRRTSMTISSAHQSADSMERLGLVKILFLSSAGPSSIPDAIPIPETHTAGAPSIPMGSSKRQSNTIRDVSKDAGAFAHHCPRVESLTGLGSAFRCAEGRRLDISSPDRSRAATGNLGRWRRCKGLPRGRRSSRALRSRRDE